MNLTSTLQEDYNPVMFPLARDDGTARKMTWTGGRGFGLATDEIA